MARMVPFPMLPTDSSAERRLYESFMEQLSEEYVVYHSVPWVLQGRHGPEEGEADFVIAHAKDGILVLETKGGRLSYDPGTRRWTQTGRDGGHRMKEDPFSQAQGEVHALVEILKDRPGWKRWMPSYGHSVAMPDGTYDTPAHPGAPAEIVIDKGDLDRLADRVREIMRYWRRGNRRFGAEGMEALADALGFRVEIRTPLALEFDEDARKIVELTDEQTWVRAYVLNRRRVAVRGSAGSGKTVLATGVARHLATAGARTLLTCFNKALGTHLRDTTADVPNLHVAHFHGLAWELATEAGLELPAEQRTDRAWFDTDLPDLLQRAAEKLGPRFDAIVVDEAQDFHEPWWPIILSLHTDPDDGTFIVFADDNQNLYGGALPGGLDEPPPLDVNLRNTEAIHGFATVFYKGTQPVRPKGPPGRPVEIMDYENDEGLARLVELVLTQLVEQEQVPLKDIVLLTPSGTAKSRLRGRGGVGRFRFSETPEPDTVLAMSVHGFKGLERPVVILAEIGDKHLDEVGGYIYQGATRASSHVIVLAAKTAARELRRARDR